MKKLLLAAPEHVGIIDVVLEGLQKYSGYEVDFLDLASGRFKYKNSGQKIYNFFLKTFTGKNLKTIYYRKIFNEKIARLDEYYETILIIRPDMLSDETLKLLREKTKRFIAYYWDTVAIIPRKLEIKNYFDKIYSFDPNDCRMYGFHFHSNFYFYETPAPATAYQVYNIFYYDSRKFLIEKIAKKLSQAGISFCLKALYRKPFKSDYISFIPKLLVYREMLQEIARAQVLLDVQKKEQRGLTFRPFEALGLNKKLITTNADIKSYDFFDEANILVLDYDDIDPEIPKSFFEIPYKEISKEKKEKYHLKNWIHTILAKANHISD